MVEYIKDLMREASTRKCSGGYRFRLVQAVAEELNRLDPRDFLPDIQSKFVVDRVTIRTLAESAPPSSDQDSFRAMVEREMAPLFGDLDSYGGLGSYRRRREFPFVLDVDLRRIVERDYHELRTILFPAGAWKSTVVLAGSILEAILVSKLTETPAIESAAEASSKAPKGKLLRAGRWTLENLIDVAVEVNTLPSERAATVDQVLRQFRNFIHPQKELRMAHSCNEAEAFLALGALDGVCDHMK